MALSPGSAFAGYHVIRRLGRGGMGEVYLVENPSLRRQEALKVIATAPGGSPQFAERFTREAHTTAALNHPGIVRLFRYGVEGATPWFTMQYLPGEDLAAARLTDPEALLVAARVADALDYAHRNGVVHRDIKPANIQVARDDGGRLREVTVLDFGIAKLTTASGMTGTGTFLGTVLYSAPEVIDGYDASPASDQYSLACTMYRLLTGVTPFSGDSPSSLMMGHLSKPPPPLSVHRPDLAHLDGVFARALAKNPYERFPTCRDFSDALAASPGPPTRTATAPSSFVPRVDRSGGPQPYTYAGPPPIPPQRRRVNSTVVLGGIAVFLTVVVGGIFAFTQFSASGGEPGGAGGVRPGLSAVAAGEGFSCAVKDGDVYCWGKNTSRVMGEAAGARVDAPTKIDGISKVTAIDATGDSVCALSAGDLYCWGVQSTAEGATEATDPPVSSTPARVEGLSGVTAFSMGGRTICAIAADLYCWGDNRSGNVGDGTTTHRSAPVKVPYLKDVRAVAVGYAVTCALEGAKPYCWGWNLEGAVGDGSTTDRNVPTLVHGITSATFLGSLQAGTCASDGAGPLMCWGRWQGPYRIGSDWTNPTPKAELGLSGVTRIASGSYTACALASNGLRCWGDGNNGQYGDGSLTLADGEKTAGPAGMTKATAVAVGGNHVCAINEGAVYCWGVGADGQLGDGGTSDRSAPVKVEKL
ncbi:MAG: protein kinase [Gordonia sp. (in: high G+C Gram-positive bacteria)]